MKKQTKTLLLIFSIIIVFIAVIVIDRSLAKENDDKLQKWRDKNMQVQFKGSVIETQIVKHGGRQYGIVCLRLDYTNQNNFYAFNDSICLKIKNGKAIMSIGFVASTDKKIKYIEVNLNNDRKERYFKVGGEVEEYDLTLSSNGVLESDLKLFKD